MAKLRIPEEASASEYLEFRKRELLEHAFTEAIDNDNTAVLLKLLDKAVPTLTKTENINANLELSAELVENVIANLGVIGTITPPQIKVGDKGVLSELPPALKYLKAQEDKADTAG